MIETRAGENEPERRIGEVAIRPIRMADRKPSLVAIAVSVLAAAGAACTNHQYLEVTNESGSPVSGMVAGKPISLEDGDTTRVAIHESTTVGLSVPLVEVRARTTGRFVGVNFDGVAYRLPADYWERLKRWEDRNWVSQMGENDAGILTYASRREVLLTLGEEEWRLFEESQVQGD